MTENNIPLLPTDIVVTKCHLLGGIDHYTAGYFKSIAEADDYIMADMIDYSLYIYRDGLFYSVSYNDNGFSVEWNSPVDLEYTI